MSTKRDFTYESRSATLAFGMMIRDLAMSVGDMIADDNIPIEEVKPSIMHFARLAESREHSGRGYELFGDIVATADPERLAECMSFVQKFELAGTIARLVAEADPDRLEFYRRDQRIRAAQAQEKTK